MPAPEECSCRCYSDVYWTCANDTVACKATLTGEEEAVVGDLVCSLRGTPKPEWSAAQRQAGECALAVAPGQTPVARLPVAVQHRPPEQCMPWYDPELDPELDLIWARTPEQEARLIPANVTPEAGSADLSFHVVKASARRVPVLFAALLALHV
jgi:hypothetical protein